MFNTLLYTKKLEAVGVTRDVAEAHVQMLAELETNFVTREDLRQELKDLEHRLVIRLSTIMGTMYTLWIGIIGVLIKVLQP